MPAERVSAKIIQALHEAGSDGVQVDVTDQFQKVGIFLAEDRLEAVLEKVSVSRWRGYNQSA